MKRSVAHRFVSTTAAAIEDAWLMFDEQRLDNDGTDTSRPRNADDGDIK